MPRLVPAIAFVATGVAGPHASVAGLTVTSQVTAAVNPLRGGVVGPTASGAPPLSEHAAASTLTRVAARARFSPRGMGDLRGRQTPRTARGAVMGPRIQTRMALNRPP